MLNEAKISGRGQTLKAESQAEATLKGKEST